MGGMPDVMGEYPKRNTEDTANMLPGMLDLVFSK
jgi:hypothetical protein